MVVKILKQHYNVSPSQKKVKVLLLIFVFSLFSFLTIIVLRERNKLLLQASQPYCDLRVAQSESQELSREQLDKYMRCSPLTIYFKDAATDVQIKSLKEEIKKLPGVYYSAYVSKEDAFIRYKEMNKNEPLEAMPEVSQFPRSLIVYVSEPNLKSPLVKLVQNSTIVATYTAPYLNFKK